jgi:chemotaxis protein methyltransferase CheR
MTLAISDFEYLASFIKKHSGIVITPDKEYLLESRLIPVASKYDVATLGDFASYCRTNINDRLCTEIIEAMTTNESFFFRDTKPFESLKNFIIPRILAKCPDKNHIKIWSAACSTGQEPYSIAMTILEEPKLASISFEIFATDIDSKVLDKAANGTYSQFEVQRGVPINLLLKYFSQAGDAWQVKDILKKNLRFEKFNLLGDPDLGNKFDIIFCRNVLIYFEKETKTKIILNMQTVMNNHSALILGGSESIMGIENCMLSPLKENNDTTAPGIFGFV